MTMRINSYPILEALHRSETVGGYINPSTSAVDLLSLYTKL
jgi:hypothetical protein